MVFLLLLPIEIKNGMEEVVLMVSGRQGVKGKVKRVSNGCNFNLIKRKKKNMMALPWQ